MAYRLFVDSSNGVSFEPEWDFDDGEQKIESAHRVKGGKRYSYLWSTYKKIKFKVMFVNSSDAAIVNSWWRTNTELLFKSESSTVVNSVMIVDNSKPLSQFIQPYDDQYQGTINLETY